MRTLYLLAPVFNERLNVPGLLAGFDARRARLLEAAAADHLCAILLDDGSTDGTAEVAQSQPVNFELVVLRHSPNRGPGAAFALGFNYLAERVQPSDLVFTLEGDNTSTFETQLRMLRRREEGYDVVLASPYAYQGGFKNTSRTRVALSFLGAFFAKLCLGLHGFHTTSSFFRLYNGETIHRLQQAFGPNIVERAGFECMVELLLKITLLEASVSEVEFMLDTARRKGNSTMRILRTIRGYFALLRYASKWRRQAAQSPGSRHPAPASPDSGIPLSVTSDSNSTVP